MRKRLVMAIVMIIIFNIINLLPAFALTYHNSSNNNEILIQKQIDNAVSYYKNNYSKESIISLQSRLNELGFSCGKADGIIGKRTVIAVAEF